MTTIDLGSPRPAPTGLLDALPRRVALTLAELRHVAEHAGGAPLPFDLVEPGGSSTLDGRLGQSRGSVQDEAYAAALAGLHDPATSLNRRGLLVGEGDATVIDEGLLGAVGLLATPTVALDLDVSAGGTQARAWHRHADDAVATLATVDGVVFELAWFPTSSWAAELARVAVVPEELSPGSSRVPALVDLPFELADTAGEAVRSGRADLLPVLAAQHAGLVTDGAGTAYTDADVALVLAALAAEGQGRLRAMVADVSGAETTVVGVVSWTLLRDGWRMLRPHQVGERLHVEVRRVEPEDLPAELSPVLAEVVT